MKLLILGACVARHDMDYLLANERGIVQHSAQNMCWRFIEGLDSAYGCQHDLLCTMRVTSYPRFRKALAFWLPPWQRGDRTTGRYVPYINLPGLRYVTTFLSAIFFIAAWAMKHRRTQDRTVVVYAMYTPCILAALALCTLFRMHSIMIVPDLPEFMNAALQQGQRASLVRRTNIAIAHWIASRYSGLVLFSGNMATKLNVSRLQWDVVEGCVGLTPTTAEPITSRDPNLKIVMYSGILEEVYGVQSLLDAFDLLEDPGARLWICGEGSMNTVVATRAASDGRITYYGTLRNSDVLVLQRSATVLINPRSGKHEFTRFSFPSKNLEYMTSGRPVVLCRMAGIPTEYFDHVYVVEGDTSTALHSVLRHVLGLSEQELAAVGIRARDFVYSQKNYIVQGEKVRRLIDRVASASAEI